MSNVRYFFENPPMATHQNLLQQRTILQSLLIRKTEKLLMPHIKLASLYASSQLYPFLKTKLLCCFTNGGLILDPHLIECSCCSSSVSMSGPQTPPLGQDKESNAPMLNIGKKQIGWLGLTKYKLVNMNCPFTINQLALSQLALLG